MEDEAVIHRIVKGDHGALGALYDLHGRVVYTLALRIVGDPAEAEEVVQDVFLQVWRGAERYDKSRATVAGWLLMMARSRAIDRVRARQARPAGSAASEIAFASLPDAAAARTPGPPLQCGREWRVCLALGQPGPGDALPDRHALRQFRRVLPGRPEWRRAKRLAEPPFRDSASYPPSVSTSNRRALP